MTSRVTVVRHKFAKRIATTLVEAGLFVTVNNGCFNICKLSRDIKEINDAMFSSDVDILLTYKSDAKRSDLFGWVEFDYRVYYKNMIQDYSPELSEYVEPEELELNLVVIPDGRKVNGQI